MSILGTILVFPLIGAFLLLFINSWKKTFIKVFALTVSLINFLLSTLLWLFFDNSAQKFQYLEMPFNRQSKESSALIEKQLSLPYISKADAELGVKTAFEQRETTHDSEIVSTIYSSMRKVDDFDQLFQTSYISKADALQGGQTMILENESSTLNFVLGLDGISLFFVILTTFLIPVCLLVGWNSIEIYVKEYTIAFLVMESLMIAVFSVLDLFLFYIFFESTLIPMFIIIGVWGSRERKIRAAYQFFLYTLFGSLLMLLAVLAIYFQAGTCSLETLYTTSWSEKDLFYYGWLFLLVLP